MKQHLPEDQHLRNLANAVRVMQMINTLDFSEVKKHLDKNDFDVALAALDKMDVPNPEGLLPEPKIIIRAEIVNAKRYYK